MSTPTADDARVAALPSRLAAVRSRVATAAAAAGRDPAGVAVLVATKAQPIPLVVAAVAAGAHLIGENRVQELAAHAPAVAHLRPTVHLIGHLQSNKVTAALPWVTCVESVDSLDLAERLSRRCVEVGRELEVLVQVNVSAEPTKFGVPPDAAVPLAEAVAALPGLRVAGFMTVGANSPDVGTVRAGYARLRQVRDDAVHRPGLTGATGLSMGMSGDLELAIAEGATTVRVGTAVFGPR